MAAEKNAQGKNEKIRDVIGKSRIAGLDLTLEKKIRADAKEILARVPTRVEIRVDYTACELPSNFKKYNTYPFVKAAIEKVGYCPVANNANSVAIQAFVLVCEERERELSEMKIVADNARTRADVAKLSDYVNGFVQSAAIGGASMFVAITFLPITMTTAIEMSTILAFLSGAVLIVQAGNSAKQANKDISWRFGNIEGERKELHLMRDEVIKAIKGDGQ